VEGTWIFGGVERDSSRSFFEPVADRSDETLLEVIHRRIRPLKIIHSDMWKGYTNLGKVGYYHCTVNHTINFVDPDTLTHTQKIEGEWSVMKRFLRSRGSNLKYHLIEYLAECI
jgi:transposase-like protein